MKRTVCLLGGIVICVGELSGFLNLKAWPVTRQPHTITAPVFQRGNTISGHVFDTSRRPIEKLDVELLDEVDSLLQRTRTDGSGRYEFRGLSTGTFQVRVLAHGTDYLSQTRRVSITSLVQGSGAPLTQEHFVLTTNPRRSSATNSASPGVVFKQDVPDTARKTFEKAVADFDGKRDEPGLDGLRKAVDEFPNYYDALERLGTEYVKRQQYEPARAVLIKAVEVNPRGYMSLYALGVAQYYLKQNADAVEALNKSISAYPNSVNAHMWLGKILMKEGKLERAETHLKRAYELGGKRVPDVHMSLAQIYSNTRRYREAADELELYLKEVPDARDTESIKKLIKQLRDKAK